MSIDPNNLPDGPTDEYKPKKKLEDSGDDIYEKPTLRIKEKPSTTKPNEGNIRES